MTKTIAIIGGGPAGLMAAERLSARGAAVTVYEAMPTVGRKFLMAGKSGLNLSHSEDLEWFISRYGDAAAWAKPHIMDLTPKMLRRWAEDLGQEMFVGSSGRLYPTAMKGSPLLRSWISRLTDQGVTFKTRHRWTGWDGDALTFDAEGENITVKADVTILALGGASWPKLGSDGTWVELLAARGVDITPFKPANCGFLVDWSDHFKESFAGEPIKSVRLKAGEEQIKGEFVISKDGLEGSGVYWLSAKLRDQIAAEGSATLTLDLTPDRPLDKLAASLERPRGKNSLSNHLRKVAGIKGVKAALLRECTSKETFSDMAALAAAIKALPITLTATRPLDEAISTAGGIALDAVDETLQLKAAPNTYAIGEMLNWEAPTGGYLLTACLAQGAWVGKQIKL